VNETYDQKEKTPLDKRDVNPNDNRILKIVIDGWVITFSSRHDKIIQTGTKRNSAYNKATQALARS
jgi:hypothetical protein